MRSFIRQPLTGLALGGGGARGLAHIGILKILQQENIPIDFIAGSSMGGLIASLFSAGVPIRKIEEEAIRLSNLVEIAKLLDLTPPHRGLIKTDKIRNYIAELLGDYKTFTDLSTPLAVTAVDLNTRQSIVLSKGSLIDAIMATTALPGLFSPVEFDKHLLVDGGVLNNVPANVVKDMGAEVVIAFDVNYIHDNDTSWKSFSKIKPLSKIIPQFALDFYQAEIIMISWITQQQLRKSRPHVLIRPNIPANVDVFLGFTHAPETIKIGEAAAQECISTIKSLTKEKFRLSKHR